MQLRALLAVAACVPLLLATSRARARADESGLAARAALETGAYADSDHVAVLTPSVAGHIESPTAGWALDASYLVDVISAASVDIVSTASRRWTEVRQAGAARASYKPGDLGASVEGSVSVEPDYVAYAVGGRVTQDLDDANVSLVAGYGFGHDLIGRAGTPFSVYGHSFDHHALTAGVTRLLDRATVLALTADATIEMGDSSKPYRYVPLFAAAVAPTVPAGATLDVVTRLRLPESVSERLPLSRDRYGVTARLAHRFAHATARLEGRVYDDSWSVVAFSSDARLLFDAGSRLVLGPHGRGYVQSGASFYRLAYVGAADSAPSFRTADRELGPLANLTAGGSARLALGPRRAPSAWVLGATLDATYTGFFADLYITRRVSALGALTLEASW